jgi:MSHA biogenesis protein MshL
MRHAPLRPTCIALALSACTLLLGACAEVPRAPSPDLVANLRAELAAARASASAVPAAAPASAPAPAAPPAAALEPASEPRFDLIVSGANARDVFQSIVGETRYSMLMHPEVTGTMSVTLRAVTIHEALESIRDVYGYDFRIDGRRITVFPPTIQTRIFVVNYPSAQRRGRSEMRVSGGSNGSSSSNNGSGNSQTGSGTANAGAVPDASQVITTITSDYWAETTEALRGLLGKGEGRAVIASPQSGTIAVRAMPDELRQVERFLRASKLSVERQVMLEAKIVEVELRDGAQSGIDWSLLRTKGAIGQVNGSATNPLLGNTKGLPTLPGAISSLLVDSVSLPQATGGTLGLALATNGFQAVLGFLETHGDVQILSSPRVATMNNQKAVLKVGTDEYFVTNVSGGTITPGSNASNGTTTLPTLTLTSFFSGIALDVTPQIDEANTITLYLRPSVTSVTEKTKQIDLGTIGSYKLPLASSSVNETDTVVRVTDGNIVAIGGLMQSESTGSRSGVPGTSGNAVGRNLLGNNVSSNRKKELVVLIKPTIIHGPDDWQRTTDQALSSFDPVAQRTIVVEPAKRVDTPVVPSAVAVPVLPAPAPVTAAAPSLSAQVISRGVYRP